MGSLAWPPTQVGSRRVRGSGGRRMRPLRSPRGQDRACQGGRRNRARPRRAQPGRHLRGGPDHARDGFPRRLPCGRGLAGHSAEPARLPRRGGGRSRSGKASGAPGPAPHGRRPCRYCAIRVGIRQTQCNALQTGAVVCKPRLGRFDSCAAPSPANRMLLRRGPLGSRKISHRLSLPRKYCQRRC